VTIDWAAIAAASVENDAVTTAQVRPFVQRAQGPLCYPLGRHLASCLAWRLAWRFAWRLAWRSPKA